MKALVKKSILRLILFLLYGMLGSGIFMWIEKTKESNVSSSNRSLAKLKSSMVSKYNLTNMTDSDFNEFVEAAHKALTARNQKEWTFVNGCGFAFATLTTVGYGDITPKTWIGKIVVIPYCLVGLPLTMLALKTCGECILLALKIASTTFEKKILGIEHPQCSFIKCFGIIVLCQFSVICLFSVVTMYMDDYSFLDGVYCWFITFTTIGFGDIIPFENYMSKQAKNQWLIHIIGFFLTIPYISGLCLVFSLLNLLVENTEKIKVEFRNSKLNLYKNDKGTSPSVDAPQRLESFTNTTT